MPRRGYKKREKKPDVLYGSSDVTRLIHYLMESGKKTVAERIVYGALDKIKEKKENPLGILSSAISQVAPNYEVRPKRVGGASYLVPHETRSSRKTFLALKWLVQAAKKRSNKEHKTMKNKIYAELMDASQGEGEAVNKKKQIEKLAEANRAFAHFRW